MMLHCSGLGQDDGSDVSSESYDWTLDTGDAGVDTSGIALQPTIQQLAAAGGEIPLYEAPIGAYTPATTTSVDFLASQGLVYDETSKTYVKSTNPVNVALATSTNANATLQALVAAGASAAQIAVAKSNATQAQAALTAAQKTATATAAAVCSKTILSGICDSYVLLGGLAIGAVVFAMAMKR